MTYAITLSPRRTPIATGFADAQAALAYVEANLSPTYIEEDADHPGCFDIFAAITGSVYCVEPIKA